MSKSSELKLSPSSFIIIGLVEQIGEATSYDLKQQADLSVGNFWEFSRAQLYKEPARLVEHGFLTEEQEETGRRRRLFKTTAKGREALKAWLRESSDAPVEIRDHGLLKLYFAENGTQADVQTLIKDQIRAHEERLAGYQEIGKSFGPDPDCDFYAAALEMGLRFERCALQFWQDLEASPPKAKKKGDK